MFTGIVHEIGTVTAVEHGPEGSVIAIAMTTVAERLRVGDSVAVDGCCLTAVSVTADGAAFEAMRETLDRTTLGDLGPGDHVNLEGALRAGDPLGGHNVQGHVDGVGGLVSERMEGFSRVLEIVPPASLLRYLVEKGSIAVAGVSLTVSALTRDGFEICLIPHTQQATTLGDLAVGSRINLEADIFAKYVERLVDARLAAPLSTRSHEPAGGSRRPGSGRAAPSAE
jgi:riboflavin synthase